MQRFGMALRLLSWPCKPTSFPEAEIPLFCVRWPPLTQRTGSSPRLSKVLRAPWTWQSRRGTKLSWKHYNMTSRFIRQGCLIASPDRYRICRLTQTFDKANNSNFGVFAFQKNRNASLDRSSFTYHSFAHRNQWLRPCPKLQPAFLRLSAMIPQYVILGFARYYLSLRTSTNDNKHHADNDNSHGNENSYSYESSRIRHHRPYPAAVLRLPRCVLFCV